MNMRYDYNASGMAWLLAEDTGAMELRNPLNSGVRAARRSSRAVHLVRALKAIVTMAFGR